MTMTLSPRPVAPRRAGAQRTDVGVDQLIPVEHVSRRDAQKIELLPQLLDAHLGRVGGRGVGVEVFSFRIFLADQGSVAIPGLLVGGAGSCEHRLLKPVVTTCFAQFAPEDAV